MVDGTATEEEEPKAEPPKEGKPEADLPKATVRPPRSRAGAFIVLLFALALLGLAGWGGKSGASAWRDVRAFSEHDLHLPIACRSVTILRSNGEESPLRMTRDGMAARLPLGKEAKALALKLYPRDGDTTPFEYRVSLVSTWSALVAAAGALLLLLALPRLFITPTLADKTSRAMAIVLSEPRKGLSLARVQLLVWLAVGLAILAAVSLPLLALPEIDGSLAVLLGLGGLTTVLGGAASPDLGNEVVSPEARDLIEDWNKQPDFTRVQCLVVTLVGAIVVLLAFFTTMEAPVIPAGFIALIGGSQATYLGTKAVKELSPRYRKEGK